MTQNEYLEILFNDVGMNRQERNVWLTFHINRPIRYLDDLKTEEKSRMIDKLKEIKENGHS